MNELFAYQYTGAKWLSSRRRGILADEMGLGKTPQAIRACDMACLNRIVVLCPAAVVVNWQREFLRWQQSERRVLLPRKPEHLAQPHDVAVLSYDMARGQAMLNALAARPWDVLICDEAHYLKNRDAARTKAAARIAGAAARAWALTGTPMPNSADELWSLFRSFGPEALGDPPLAYWPFRKRYCVEVPLGRGPHGRSMIVGLKNDGELRERMAPVLLRRKKADVLRDLPPLREGEIPLSAGDGAELRNAIAADPEIRVLVQRVAATALLSNDVDNDVRQVLEDASADSMSRLRRLTAAIKARVLGPLLAEEIADSGEKIVVMGWHRETLDTLHGLLDRFGVARLDGGCLPAQRQAAIDAFQIDPKIRVFLGQIQAAGTGITLTAASNLVFAEMSWVPSDNAQAAMRVHRVGQTRPVLIRYATLADTIDEAVIRTLRRKTQHIRTVLEGAPA